MIVAPSGMERPPANPAGRSPLRRAESLRRTSTIDTSWPGGRDQPKTLFGRARDIWTQSAGSEPVVLAQDEMEIVAASRRRVISLQTRPAVPELRRRVEAEGGRLNRGLLAEVFTDPTLIGTPLYLLLDDYSGATLVSNWAWSQWVEDWMTHPRSFPTSRNVGPQGIMEGVCAGFRPGSSALMPAGSTGIANQSTAAVPSLLHPDDPAGWHELPAQQGVGMRRARRIDVWMEREVLTIDAAFQDSATTPTGGRVAVHEYLVEATADARDLVLRTLRVEPRILPYPECPAATANAQRMIGTKLPDLRKTVLQTLAGTLGCTHLNDILRSFADVPRLALETRKRVATGMTSP
jgi:hypothetical protein